MGFSTLLLFIKLNGGKVQIILGDGYWDSDKSEPYKKIFDNYFDGTVVNIEFNLNDESSYILSNEESLESLF